MSFDKVPKKIIQLIQESTGRPKIVEYYKNEASAMRAWKRWINQTYNLYGLQYDIVQEDGRYRLRLNEHINEKQLMFAILKYT